MRAKPLLLAAILALAILLRPLRAEIALESCKVSSSVADELLQRTRDSFYHAYNAYKHNAYPCDELRPLSCVGDDTFGGVQATLVDTLDTLVLLRDWPEFAWAARRVANTLTFDVNTTVSVFEINIRVLGGLLSAHGFLTEGFDDSRFDAWLWWPGYAGELLYLAWQLVERLMPAFRTPTGIPFGALHLQHGVLEDESRVASTAGAGSLLLEFGTVSRLTGDPRYYEAAFRAMSALHERAAWTGLVGNHINIVSGQWVATDSGVGGLIDSFYEYMLKGYILFADVRLLAMYESSYEAIQKFIKRGEWFLDADMDTGQTASLAYSSLAAFFPGLQTLMGLSADASVTTRAHYAVWRRYGAVPEGWHVSASAPVEGMVNYPLRPELVESVFYHHWATGDSSWVGVARGVLTALERGMKVDCGFAQVENVVTRARGDLMDSFLMSETLKYLYLVFLGDERHWARSGRYVFTTEAHPLRVSTESITEILGSASADRTRAHRWKCRRSARVEGRLPCGYGLAGTDYAVFDVKSVLAEEVAADVAGQVAAVVREHGTRGVKVGGVFVGSESAYRVVRVRGGEVLFAKMEVDEARREREGAGGLGGCGRIAGWEFVRGVCRWKAG